MANLNKALIAAGSFSLGIAILHLLIILGGADWYRLFGAGEALAQLSEQGSIYPATITMMIALIFLLWAVYAFSGSGLIRRLPWIKPVLILITVIYLIRGLGLIPILFIAPDSVDTFLVTTSVISFLIGILHLTGVRQLAQTAR